ncbi:MAG TPA: hypothetical protein VJ983_06200 [candidate division Zixibacteria bacterium]|nr:hypothetical protein [candidate division Zixibacteria bacterium]
MRHRYFAWTLLALLTASTIGAQNQRKYYVSSDEEIKDNFFELGLGYVSGGAYKDALAESHPDWTISGLGGWIYLETGLGFSVAPKIKLTPNLAVLGTYIKYHTYPGFPSSVDATLILLPGVEGRLDFNSAPSTPFVAANVSYVVPTSDLEAPILSGGSIAIGASFGFHFREGFELLFTYRHVPVEYSSGEITYDGPFGQPLGTDKTTTNFGGAGITFRRLWSF